MNKDKRGDDKIYVLYACLRQQKHYAHAYFKVMEE